MNGSLETSQCIGAMCFQIGETGVKSASRLSENWEIIQRKYLESYDILGPEQFSTDETVVVVAEEANSVIFVQGREYPALPESTVEPM